MRCRKKLQGEETGHEPNQQLSNPDLILTTGRQWLPVSQLLIPPECRHYSCYYRSRRRCTHSANTSNRQVHSRYFECSTDCVGFGKSFSYLRDARSNTDCRSN